MLDKHNTLWNYEVERGEEEMEEIIKTLEGIAQDQISCNEKNKTIPSSDVLDIVKLIMTYRFSQTNL